MMQFDFHTYAFLYIKRESNPFIKLNLGYSLRQKRKIIDKIKASISTEECLAICVIGRTCLAKEYLKSKQIPRILKTNSYTTLKTGMCNIIITTGGDKQRSSLPKTISRFKYFSPEIQLIFVSFKQCYRKRKTI